MGATRNKLLLAAAWIAMLLLAADILQPLHTLVTKNIVEGCLIPDFIQFYLAGKLVAEGRSSELYHRPTYEAMTAELAAQGNGVYSWHFNRPAFDALLSAPFSWFPYLTAARIAVLINFAFLGFLVWKLPLWFGASRHLRILLVAFIPFLWSLGICQDTLLLTVLVAYALRLLSRDQEVLAGALLALCAFKPHVIWLLPLALLAGGRRRAFYSMVAVGAGLAGLSFLMIGPTGLREWIAILRAPTTDFSPPIMGNVRALALHFGLAAGIIAGLLTVVAFAIVLRMGSFYDKFLAALVAGLLLSPHVYLQDYSPLALLAVITGYPIVRYLLLLPWPYFYFREDLLPWIPLLLGYLIYQSFDLLRRPAQSASPEVSAGGAALVYDSPVAAPEVGVEGHSGRRPA